MRSITYSLSVILLVIFSVCKVESLQAANNDAEAAPGFNQISYSQTAIQKKALWDVLFSYNLHDSIFSDAWAGANYMFGEFWVSIWNADTIAILNTDGSLVNVLDIGIGEIRAFTSDSNYVYATNNTATIYRIDPNTKMLAPPHLNLSVGTTIRHCSFDQTLDNGSGGFWVGNWDTDLISINMQGNQLSAIPASNHGLTGMYGSAVDNFSSGGPFLWVFNQGGNNLVDLVQVSLANGSTITTHDVYDDIGINFGLPAGQGLAGGAFISSTAVPGKIVLGGLYQGSPDVLFGYEYDASQLPCVQITNAAVVDASCNGVADGSINLTVSGGVAPYQFSWSNGGSSANQLNLTAGSYVVSITDANNCTETIETYTISEPSAIVIGASQANESCSGCNDGAATVTAIGGAPPYTYSWNTTPQTNGATATGLSAGAYTVTVTDQNGCTNTLTLTIGVASSIDEAGLIKELLISETGLNIFNVSAKLASPDFLILRIFDVNGKIVMNKNLDINVSFNFDLDLDYLEAGMYIMEFSASNARGVKKLIVK